MRFLGKFLLIFVVIFAIGYIFMDFTENKIYNPLAVFGEYHSELRFKGYEYPTPDTTYYNGKIVRINVYTFGRQIFKPVKIYDVNTSGRWLIVILTILSLGLSCITEETTTETETTNA